MSPADAAQQKDKERIAELEAANLELRKSGYSRADEKHIAELEASVEAEKKAFQLGQDARQGQNDERIAELEEVAEFHQVAFSDVDEENRVFIKEAEEKDKRIAELEAKLETAYIKGWERAVWLYAINRDGRLLVGIMEKDYKDVVAEGPDKDYMHSVLEKQ